MNTASKKPNERLQPFVARRAFMLIELLVLITVLALLVFTQMARLSEAREKLFVTIDLNNMRQILRASALYNADHDDQMAHPTWGSDLTSPDGWAYLTSTKNESVPGALQPTPGSCTGRSITSKQFTNQLAFFKAGQVTRYYRTWKPPGVPRTWRHALPPD